MPSSTSAVVRRLSVLLRSNYHILSTAILIGLILLTVPQSSAQTASRALFVEVPAAADARVSELRSPFDPIERLRSRGIGMNPQTIKALLDSAKDAASVRALSTSPIELNLFRDTVLPFFVDSIEATADGVGHTLKGAVGEFRDGTAILTIYQGALSGSVRLANGEQYQIFVPTSGLGEVEQQRFRGYAHPELDYVLPDALESGTRGLDGREASRGSVDARFAKGLDLGAFSNAVVSASTIDVLVAYTTRAKDARGGAAGMLSHINQVIAESNAGLANSHVNMAFRLVHAVEVSWDDSQSGMNYNTTLSALRSSTDTAMNEVHALRDQYGADVVSIFVNPPLPTSGTFTVGLAYMLTNNPPGFAGYAFSVVHQTYAGGTSLTFPHEIGHNLGLNHDADHGGSNGGYVSDAKGYQQKTLSPYFFTIMAYSSDCSGCTPINYFSNPNVSYQGIPTGVSGTVDAARTIELVRQDAAAWRAEAGPSCSYELGSTSASIGSAASSTAVSVSSSSGCAWTAVSNAAWITVSAGSGGSGSGSVSLSIAANSAQSSRTGTVSIAGKTFTVNQAAAPAPCSYSLSGGSISISDAASPASVGVNSASGCSWSAVSNAAWITVSGGASGSGNGTVSLSIAANTAQSPRTGTVTVAGNTFTVQQAAAPAPCSYSLSTSSTSVSYGAASASIGVSAGSGCSWSATSNAAWITVSGGASGSANGTVSLSIAANPAQSARTGTVTIAGNTFTVQQSAAPAPCSYSLNSGSSSVGYGANILYVTVSAGSGCAWTAASSAAWISVSSGATGSGSGTVSLSVEANPTQSPRTGTLTIAGNTYTVQQSAAPAPCTFSLSSNAVSVAYQSNAANVGVVSGSGCSWSAASNAAWIGVTAGAQGTGNGTVSLSIAENTTQSSRTGTVTISGVTFTVSQGPAPAPCTYSLSRGSASVGNGANSVGVDVATASGCSWSASSGVNWINIASGTNGSGSGTVTLAIAENTAQASREATVTVAGATFTVQQAAAPVPCSYAISPGSVSLDYAGGGTSVAVTSNSGCSWSATSSVGWITVSGNPNGSGSGTVGLSVAANPSTSARSGSVTVAGNTFTVQQAGAPPVVSCSYTLNSTSFSTPHDASSVFVQVSAGGTCQWQAASNSGWLSISSGANGTGSGMVTVQVQANTSNAARTGTLTVAGQSVTVTQAGQPVLPTLTISPSRLILSAPFGSSGAVSATVAVEAAGSQVAFAQTGSLPSWLRVAASSGSTPATLNVSANPAGLAPGSYEATVVLNSTGTANSQSSLLVTLHVESLVVLRTSPRALSFSNAYGNLTPTTQSMRVMLIGSSSPLRAFSNGASWLTAEAQLVKNSWIVKATANPSGLLPGVYDSQIGLTCMTANCQTVMIPVRIHVFATSQSDNEGSGEHQTRIASGGIVNAGSFLQGLTDGSWMSIFGDDLAAETRTWQLEDFDGPRFPLSVAGVQVKVDGKPAAIHFASPGQVNFQAPSGLTKGWVLVEMSTPYGSDQAYAYVSKENPGFFQVDAEGQVAALHADGRAVGRFTEGPYVNAFTPAKPGDVVAIFGTGFGPTDPDVKSGEIFQGAAELIAKGAVRVSVGGVEADVAFIGLSGAGLNQLNIRIPNLPKGDHDIQAVIDGAPTQFVGKIAID